MLRRVLLFGSLGVLALAPLEAQERRPARARVWVDGDEVRPFDLLARRRARIGVTLDMRAVENDSIGATIEAVTPGGPAAKAGLRSGDIITRFNGRALVRADRDRYDRDRSERDRSERDPSERDRSERDRSERDRSDRDRSDRDRDDRDRDRELQFNEDDQSIAAVRLIEMVARLEPGDTVAIEYRRGDDGESRTANVVTSKEFAIGSDRDFTFMFPEDGERVMPKVRAFRGDGPMVMSFGGPFADLELAPLNSDLGSYFGTSEGVLVIDAPEKNSLGLRGGDVILSVDGRTARGPASLLRVLRSYEDGDVIKLEIMRNKSRQTISSKVAHDDED